MERKLATFEKTAWHTELFKTYREKYFRLLIRCYIKISSRIIAKSGGLLSSNILRHVHIKINEFEFTK